MSGEQLRRTSLRKAFAAVAEVAGDGSGCPEPQRLWSSAREELDRRQNEELILHLGDCTACAAAWRLARELSRPQTGQDASAAFPSRRPAGRAPRWVPLAAAAVLVVAAGALLVPRLAERPIDGPVYRTQEEHWLESTLEPEAILPRGACMLSWMGGPDGTTYAMRVTTERLDPLARAAGLAEPRYLVPEEALAGLESGEKILWRVTAYLPDGRRVHSRTFVTRVR